MPAAFVAPGSFSHAAARHFDRLPGPAAVCVANNIGQSFINGASQRPAFACGKAHLFGQAHHRAAHHAQHFRIARQLKSEEPVSAMQFEASLEARAGHSARPRTKSIPVQGQMWSNKLLMDRRDGAMTCGNAYSARAGVSIVAPLIAATLPYVRNGKTPLAAGTCL